MKTSLNLPITKLEPRPPVSPRIFDKLLRFLDNAIPAGNAINTPKRRGRPPNSTSASKRSRPDDDNIDPELRTEDDQAASAPKSRRRYVRKPALLDDGEADAVGAEQRPGSPKWLEKFLKRLRPKLQEMLAEHAWNRILHDDAFLFRVVDAGVRYARQPPSELSADGSEQAMLPKDNTPSAVIAVLIVALQWHLGGMALEVPKFAKFCAQELAAGGVLKVTAFGAVVGDAQDLAEEKRDEWMGVGWCAGGFAEDDERGEGAVTAEQGEAEAGAERVGDDEHDDGPIEVPRSRCGPMAQAHPDYADPERKKDLAQWKGEMLKKATAIEKEQDEQGEQEPTS